MLFSSHIYALSLVIFLGPLAGFVFLALFHKKLFRHGDWLATLTMGLGLCFSLIIFAQVGGQESSLVLDISFSWLPLTSHNSVVGGVMVDRLTSIMLVVVTLVSFLVHLFSVKYMEGDLRYGRYFCCLQLFSVSMLGLVLVNNLLFLFIFWELVGLSSYLLIGHWFGKKSASDAAIKAFITTRIGDVGMFIGLLICYLQVGSLHYADIFAAVNNGILDGGWRTAAALGLFFGAMGKSAQFPLHVWLPDAMEGPTPVSALIHAATMVAAGVYLTGRMLPLFDDTALFWVAHVGAFTALFAATIALVQDDIKKVLAYSTVSQLGYMIMALGVGGYVSGLFHLTTHAFFKAGLFLGSGAIIYAMHHEQSLSKYGGLWKKLPWTAACYLLCTLALTGFPGFSGFWSKDAILADTLVFSMKKGYWFLPIAGFTTVFLTAFYMFRQFFLTFTGKPRDRHAYEHAHEVPWQMLVPLIVLGVLALAGGGFGGWFGEFNPKREGIEQVGEFQKKGHSLPGTFEVLRYANQEEKSLETSHEVHGAHNTAMMLSTGLGLLGIIFGGLFYFERKNGSTLLSAEAVKNRFPLVHRVLSRKYYLDELYWGLIVLGTHLVSRVIAAFDRVVVDGIVNFVGSLGRIFSVVIEVIDRVAVDGVGVLGPARLTAYAGEKLSYVHTGYVRQYLAMTVFGIIVVILVWTSHAQMRCPGVQGRDASTNREYFTVWSPTEVRHQARDGGGRASE